jgi:hypothetical protein
VLPEEELLSELESLEESLLLSDELSELESLEESLELSEEESELLSELESELLSELLSLELSEELSLDADTGMILLTAGGCPGEELAIVSDDATEEA